VNSFLSVKFEFTYFSFGKKKKYNSALLRSKKQAFWQKKTANGFVR
jgi:hypothetical protein